MRENIFRHRNFKILLTSFLYALLLYVYLIYDFPLAQLNLTDSIILKLLGNVFYFIAIWYFCQRIISEYLSKEMLKFIVILILILAFNRVLGVMSKTFISSLAFSYEEKVGLFTILTLFLKSLFMIVPILYFWSKFSTLPLSKIFKIELTHYKYYATMLLFMIPLLYYASTLNSFQQLYPRYNLEVFETAFHPITTFTVFYLIYLSNFIAVELYFRGALVLYKGSNSLIERVLPMIVIYSFYHIGKPLEELISAVFGGLILGMIAYRTKSIMGGIYMHICIAFFMDIFVMINR